MSHLHRQRVQRVMGLGLALFAGVWAAALGEGHDEALAQAAVTPAPVEPGSGGDEASRVLALGPAASTSRGGPSAGALEGGVPFPLGAPGARFNPRRDPRARYGTVELVQALLRAGESVRSRLGGQLIVNDLSLAGGGPIPHHGSHQGGRDADALFYTLDGHGQPIPSVGAPLDLDGRGVDFQDLSVAADDVPVQLDVARTWAFVEALLGDPRAAVQRIFVARHLRQRLLRHAQRTHAPAALVRRFGQVACQPGYPHDDHFHIRVFCSVDDVSAGCRDSGPMPPWQRAHLATAGVTPHMAGPERFRAPVTTVEAARREAGVMDVAVRAWLERREAWLQPPRGPGVCR